MQFEMTGDSQHPYKLTFEGDEIEVAGAVYREEIYESAKRGNVGSISDFDLFVASWNEGDPRSIKVIDHSSFAQKFEDFYDRTADAVVEIAQESAAAPFLNDEIICRYEIGKRALELAELIREKVDSLPAIEDSVVLGDLDAAFSPLLGGEERPDQND